VNKVLNSFFKSKDMLCHRLFYIAGKS